MELEAFVRDPQRSGLPQQYDFRAFWFGGGQLRQSGVVGAMNLERQSLNVLAEFVHPPFGYVLSLSGEMSDRRPERISDFAKYGIEERIVLHRRLPVLQTHWLMPGDYRTIAQIARDTKVNALSEHGVPDAEAVVDHLEHLGIDFDPDVL